MAELSPPEPGLQRFYAADQEIPEVDDAVAQRLLLRIQGAAVASGAAAAATTATNTVATSARVVSWKVAIAIAATSFAVGAATGVAFLGQLPSEAPPPERKDNAPDAQEVLLVPAAPDREREVATEVLLAPPRPPLDRAPAPRSDPVTTTDIEPPSSLEEERRLLEAARAALARGRAGHAQNLLARHRSRFGNGELTEERESLRIEVAVVAGRHADAISLGDRFLRERPNSLYRARVRRLVDDARERSHPDVPSFDREPSPDTSLSEPRR